MSVRDPSSHRLLTHNDRQRVLLSLPRHEWHPQEFLHAVESFASQCEGFPFGINLCRTRIGFMIAFAALVTRQIANLLPGDDQTSTIEKLQQHYQHSQVIVDSANDAVRFAPALHIKPTLGASSPQHPQQQPAIANPESIAAIPFTSGSTGAPAPHPKRWGAMIWTAQATEKQFFEGLDSYSVLATVPTQHMYGLEMTLMLMLAGRATIAGERPLLPADMETALRRLPEPRVLVTTPIHLRALARANTPLPPLYKIVSATAPLSDDLAALIEQQYACEVWEIYGCTEAGTLATRRTLNGNAWTLLDGMGIESTSPLSASVTGPQLRTPVALPDQIHCLNPKQFVLIGRGGDLINVAGKRASLADLTQKLMSIPGVLDAHVSSSEDDVGRLRALVVTSGLKS